MMKRLSLILVVVLLVPMLLSACGSDTKKVAEDYMVAVLKGDSVKAKEKACDDFKDQTDAYIAAYKAITPNIHKDSIDLKFDIGKGNNQEEVIVTGAYDYGDKDNPKEYVFASSTRKYNNSDEMSETRVVLWMKKDGDNWCVSAKSEFSDKDLKAVPPAETPEPATTEEPTPAMTEEPEPVETQESTPVMTEEPAPAATKKP